jgi:hypothetical protein
VEAVPSPLSASEELIENLGPMAGLILEPTIDVPAEFFNERLPLPRLSTPTPNIEVADPFSMLKTVVFEEPFAVRTEDGEDVPIPIFPADSAMMESPIAEALVAFGK